MTTPGAHPRRTPAFQPRTRVAIRAAEAAAAIQLARLGRAAITWKGAGNPVTDADRRAERMVRRVLQAAYPRDAILGEETGGTGAFPYRWLVDPIDGTINYTHGVPHFAVALALEHAGRPVSGVILDPVLDELFVAEAGRGAWLRQRRAPRARGRPWSRLRVSRVSVSHRTLLATCSHDMPRDTGNLGHVAALAGIVQRVYTLGSAALELAWVAAGRLEGFWEPSLPSWDTVAGALLVREAGGRVTDYAGAPWSGPAGQIVASNGRVHALLLRRLRQHRHGW